MEDKGNSKGGAVCIKRLSNQKYVVYSDSDASPRVPHKKKAGTGFLLAQKKKNKTPIMEEPSATICCIRSLELLNASTFHRDLVPHLERVPTKHPLIGSVRYPR